MQDRRKTNELLEGCPRGQREQTVNLPAYAFEGSNPSPSTLFRSLATTLRRRKAYGIRPRFAGANRCREEGHAGVAQLVEHQPSKLRVASSNLVSRSQLPLI